MAITITWNHVIDYDYPNPVSEWVSEWQISTMENHIIHANLKYPSPPNSMVNLLIHISKL